MPLPHEVRRRLEVKAKEARAEFSANWQQWSVKDVARWWQRWCTFDGTNHDRLGHILMEETGVKRSTVVEWTDDER